VYLIVVYYYCSLVQWSGDHGGIVTCGSWSHDDKFIVTGSDLDLAIRIWDSQTGVLVQTIKGEFCSLQCNKTDLWYRLSYRKFRSVFTCLGGTDAVVFQSNFVRRTCCLRIMRSSCLGWGSNPYSPCSRLTAQTNLPPSHYKYCKMLCTVSHKYSRQVQSS